MHMPVRHSLCMLPDMAGCLLLCRIRTPHLQATATHRLQASIIECLRLKDPKIVTASFNRPNIELTVRHKALLGACGSDDDVVEVRGARMWCVSAPDAMFLACARARSRAHTHTHTHTRLSTPPPPACLPGLPLNRTCWHSSQSAPASAALCTSGSGAWRDHSD